MQVIRDASTKSAKRTLEPTGHPPQWSDPTQATQETQEAQEAQGENTPSHMPDTELIALLLAPLSGVNPPLRPSYFSSRLISGMTSCTTTPAN